MRITRYYNTNKDPMEKKMETVLFDFEVAHFYSFIINWNIHVTNTHERRYPYKDSSWFVTQSSIWHKYEE